MADNDVSGREFPKRGAGWPASRRGDVGAGAGGSRTGGPTRAGGFAMPPGPAAASGTPLSAGMSCSGSRCHSGSLYGEDREKHGPTMNATSNPMPDPIAPGVRSRAGAPCGVALEGLGELEQHFFQAARLFAHAHHVHGERAGTGCGSRMIAAIVPPSLTSCAIRLTAPAIAVCSHVATTAMAPSTGTPLFSMVPSVRVKRAVSIFVASGPRIGSRSTH